MKKMLSHRFFPVALLIVMTIAGGCQKIYYGTMEKSIDEANTFIQEMTQQES